jgi:uncharacterized protein
MIKNISMKRVISNDEKHLNNSFSKAIGLMFSFKPKTLVFHFSNSRIINLHMFFVFFPIDIMFLDSNKKIIELKENFLPFTVYASKKKALYLIEAKHGFIRKNKLRTNHELEFY